jgi:hypothetical protein
VSDRACCPGCAPLDDEQQGTEETEATTLESALRIGALLLDAKEIVSGPWPVWLDEHCDVNWRQANRYMRLARYEDRVRASGAGNIAAALRALQGERRTNGNTGMPRFSAKVAYRRSMARVNDTREDLLKLATVEADEQRKRAYWDAWELVREAELILEGLQEAA